MNLNDFFIQKNIEFIFFRANGIGKNMKKPENFIELSIKSVRIIKSIGNTKKCVFVNEQLHSISSTKYESITNH